MVSVREPSRYTGHNLQLRSRKASKETAVSEVGGEGGHRRGDRPPAQAAADTRQCVPAAKPEQRKSGDKKEEEERIILAIAEEHLDKASSLLSSVRREKRGAGDNGGTLDLDILDNIGRLEETRERIGSAIEIYQAVQERRGEVGGWPPPPTPGVTFQATVSTEHRVVQEPREVVITRTVNRGRRSGVEDDRRDGQLWEEGALSGGADGEYPPPRRIESPI